jgi:uncharacterized repeat protein (TIGR01451 family)
MDVRLFAAAVAISLSASSTTSAAINDWSAIGPIGGAITKIVYGKTANTVFLIAAGGFYRSQDGGVTWRLIKSDFMNVPFDLEIDPSDASRIYVVSPNAPSLYVSTDGGSTMSALTTLPTAISTALQLAVSQDGTTLYLTSLSQVFVSSDRGQTWIERTPISAVTGDRINKLIIDPSDPKTLYAAAQTSVTGEGIFITHDGAVTWQQVTTASASTMVPGALAINPLNPSQVWAAQFDGVWMSSDRGAHWSNVFPTAVSAIAVDPSNPAIVYAGGGSSNVYRTADAGTNWIAVSGNDAAGQLDAIAVNPAQDSQVLVGGLAGLFATSTSGTTWTPQQSGIVSTDIAGFSADLSADRIYILAQNTGLFFTANGAATTLPVNNDALLASGTFNGSAILAQPGRLCVSLSAGFARSADGGQTWSVVNVTGGGGNNMTAIASSPSTPQTILGLTRGGGLYRSIDGGDLWVPDNTGWPANSSMGQLLSASPDPSVAYSILDSNLNGSLGVYKSVDAGSSWAQITAASLSPDLLLAVDPTNPAVVYGRTDSALLKSSDGGVSWAPLNWPINTWHSYPIGLAIDPLHPNILYAAGVSGVARSVDRGSTWETLHDPNVLPFWAAFSLIADPKRPENILVGTAQSGVQQLTVAPDLTLTVTAPSTPLGVGTSANFDYQVSNQGPFDATGVTVTLQLPLTAQNLAAAASGATCTVVASSATCVFAIMRAHAVVDLTLTSTAPVAGNFQMSGAIVGDQPDSDPTNNAVASTSVVEPLANLSVTATGSTSAHVGDAVSYTLVATNAGPNVASATQLTFQLAAGLTFTNVSSTAATCTAASGLITCNLNDLAVATPVSIMVSASAATLGTQTSAASIKSATTDLVSANNSASTSTAVSAVPSSGGGGGAISRNDVLALLLLSFAARLSKWHARRSVIRLPV